MSELMQIKFASDQEKAEGWTLSPSFLEEISDVIDDLEDTPSLEGIELVILAYHQIIR